MASHHGASSGDGKRQRPATIADARSLMNQSAAMEELAQDILSRRRAV